MASDTERNAQGEIRQLLKSMSEAWVSGHPEELEEYFHEDMVIALPGFGRRGVGKRACVESYKELTSRATIQDFRESDPLIDVWGDTAVASYRFELDYEMSGQEHHDSGQDLFVFARERGNWRAVWRTIIPLSAGE